MDRPSLGKYISTIYRHQSIILNKQFEKYGIGYGQYIFLVHIAENQGITQKGLSEQIKIDRANTHRAIKKLEALGYIYTKRDTDDKRNIRSYLTKNGEELIPSIMEVLSHVTEVMVRNLDKSQQQLLFNLLQQVEGNVKHHVTLLREE